jgi:hypothetical protein
MYAADTRQRCLAARAGSATAVIETLLVPGLFLVVDVAETAWNVEIEDKLVKNIKSFVG